MKKYLYSLIFLFLFIPFYANAASLRLETPKDEYHLGDSFTANLFLDIDKSCVNTVETKITFPKGLLYIDNFVTGESLINVWVSEPSETDIYDANDKGKLYIAGGIPGGYCGKIPGDPGDSNLVGKILFRIPSLYVGNAIPENLEVKLIDSSVYINDGLGTKDKLKIENLKLKLNKTPGNEIGDYNALVKSDTKKPEPFVVELQKNDNLFQGQYYAIFSSIDKQSGIDHYELKEEKNISHKKTLTEKVKDFFVKPKPAEWKVAKIPYLLEDQTLRSIIKVKAIDKAGNERSVEYIPDEPSTVKTPNYDYLIIAFVVLLLIVGIFIFYKLIKFILRFFRKKESVKEDVKDDSLENEEKTN